MTTRGRGTPRQCPVGGPGLDQCPRVVRQGYLMCGPHWHAVPKDVQTEVWRSWRAWQKQMTDEAWAAYAAARAQALSALGVTP